MNKPSINKSFRKLTVWQYSRSLTYDFYIRSNHFPAEEKFILLSQMKKSVISVSFNIAEGIGRKTIKDTLHFMYISRGSLHKFESQLFFST